MGLTLLDALWLSLIGITLIMAVLVLLMFIIKIMSYFTMKGESIKAKNAQKKIKLNYAEGTCGDLTLIDTTEREAALIMAIVADSLETPINELRFKSIKLIGEGK
ncbi:MAG TPA: OadG family protein [Eubacteriales bacterium]|nr:OadG family protein [Eubacteriales bacterium]